MSDSSEAGELPIEGLMDRVQIGDMEAYQELIRRYQRKLFRFISSYHRDPEDANEVLQDTFMKVYTARRTWECKTSFSAWLYRIAANASIDRHRRGIRHRATSFDDLPESELNGSNVVRAPCTPLDRLAADERRHVLERAIRRLPDRQREVVALRYFGEMQLEEISAFLGCPLGTVKSNLHKAILALRGLLRGKREVLDHA